MRDRILQLIRESGPAGIAARLLGERLQVDVSRATLQRHLASLCVEGLIEPVGKGPATRYVTTSPFSRADIDAYFARHWQSRPVAPFREAYLAPQPGLHPERAARCRRIQGLANPMDRKYLAEFLVDFTWGSSTRRTTCAGWRRSMNSVRCT